MLIFFTMMFLSDIRVVVVGDRQDASMIEVSDYSAGSCEVDGNRQPYGTVNVTVVIAL
jgi:hypothetical protein